MRSSYCFSIATLAALVSGVAATTPHAQMVDDAIRSGFAQEDHKTAPAIGITLAHRY